MTLRLKAPKFVRKAIGKYISKCISEDAEVDVNFQITEMEIGMRDKRAYTKLSVNADIDRKDIVKLVKNAYL